MDPQRKVLGGEDDDVQEFLGNLDNPREKVLAIARIVLRALIDLGCTTDCKGKSQQQLKIT